MTPLIKCILVLVVVALGVCTIATVNSQRRKLYIINGFFFHRLPVDKSLIVEKITFDSPSGNKVIAISTGLPLSDLQIQDSLPPALIPDSDLLIRHYHALFPDHP